MVYSYGNKKFVKILQNYIVIFFLATNSIWSVGNQTTNVISNPFTTGDLWRPSNVVNNNTQSIDTSLYNPINPFKPVQFPVNNGKI